jgi:hypothetical protein
MKLIQSPRLRRDAAKRWHWEGQTMKIKDRVFIVTGASSGIGMSTAIALSGRGAKVAFSLAAPMR